MKIVSSRILKACSNMAEYIYRAMGRSAVGRTLTRYEDERYIAEKSFFFRLLVNLRTSLNIKKIKLKVLEGFEDSVILSKVKHIINILLLAYIYQYGVFALSFGLGTCFSYLLRRYILGNTAVPIFDFVVGGTIIIISLPMLFSRKSLAESLCESNLSSFVLFNVLGLRRESLIGINVKTKHRVYIAVLAGLSGAALTYLFSPLKILISVLFLIFAGVLLSSPESGIVLLFMSVPFASNRVLGFYIIFLFFCYFLKVIRGKRTFVVELTDFAVLMFAAAVFFGGIFSITPYMSFRHGVKLVFFIFAYILIVNMIKTRIWIDRCVSALMFSCTVVSILGLMQKFAANVDFILTEELFGDMAVSGTFESPDVLAQYILLCMFFFFAYFIEISSRIRKLFVVYLSCFVLLCLYYTTSVWAILAFVIAGLLFFLIYSNKTIIALICGLLVAPFYSYILPPRITERITEISDIGISVILYRIKIWKISLMMIRDHFIGGSGTGTFSHLFTQYATEGIESAVSSYNIYLQAIIEIGIFGFLVFVAVILVFTQSNLSFYSSVGGGKEVLLSAASFCGIAAILLLGATDYVWQDNRIFLTFWLVMGIGTAFRRQNINERRGIDNYKSYGRL